MKRGDRIAGRFELRERTASGGMGEVFQALDTATDRLVALKILRDTSDRERFEHEARALKELDHPAIVRLIAHGVTEESAPYLAMEWLEGEDLATLLRRRRLDLAEALALARCVAGALGAAHARGMIHRDIKPSNLFLVQGDLRQTRLLDFGIARFAGQTRMTRTGAILGTPGYMAPEQARGDGTLTPALDIFALGCVLFEVLVGRPAFEGHHMVAVLAKILFMDAPRLEAHCPEAPSEFAALVSRMMAKDPAARPRDGVALLAELEGFTGFEALAARQKPSGPVSPPGPPPGSLTQDEQRMVSVLLIGSGQEAVSLEEGRTLSSEARLVAEQAGGCLECLADGSIAVTFDAHRVVKDQVSLAARLALSLRPLQPGVPIALATGRGTIRKATTLGEAIERAAQRLEQQAGTRSPALRPIAIDDTTAALLDARFEWREGPGGPELWGENDQLGTTRTLLGKPTPCVGREIELRVLEQAFDICVEEPSAEVFLVTAQAGMGKSRLAHEFIQAIRRRAPEVAIWFARADSTRAGSALHLLGQALRSALGIQSSEPLEARHEKLRARLAGHGSTAQAPRLLEFLGELVGAPFGEPGSAQLMAARQDAQLMARQLQRAFEDFLLAESAAHPVVLILDDLHWGDAASVRFVDTTLRSAMDRPVLVLGLARPEVHAQFPGLWSERGLQEIHLRALTRRSSERLVRAALGDSLVGEPLERLIAQAEGNAFYLEELIRAAAEGKSALPDTAVAMVQSRLGAQEPDARRVLRAASVFGEIFWKGAAIALLGGMRASQAVDWLALLVQREVLVRRPESRFPGEEEFAFRHALLREGAYAMLTEEDRTLGHRLAGEWLEQHGEGDALALAQHFERGGELERAVHHYVRAADHAAEANDTEAILSCVERGLRCNPRGEPRGDLLSLKASVQLGHERYAETFALAAEALELLPAGSKRWYMALHDLFPAAALTQPASFPDYARRFLEVSPSPQARPEFIRSGAWLLVVLELTGAKDAAYGLLSRLRAESVHLSANDMSSRAYFRGTEGNHYHLAEEAPWSCWQVDTESMHAAEQAEMWWLRCVMGSYVGKALMELGERVRAETVLRENLALAQQRGDELARMYARLYLSRCLAEGAPLDQLDEPEQLARACIASRNASLLGLSHGVLAQLALRRGELETAEAEARLACEKVQPFPAYSWDLIALWMRILRMLGRKEEALGVGEDALQRFERIGLGGYGELELRLAVAEAREATGQLEAARELLRSTLPRLRLRVDGMPDTATRRRYLTEVPTQARLLTLAREWLGDAALREARLGPEELGAA